MTILFKFLEINLQSIKGVNINMLLGLTVNEFSLTKINDVLTASDAVQLHSRSLLYGI